MERDLPGENRGGSRSVRPGAAQWDGNVRLRGCRLLYQGTAIIIQQTLNGDLVCLLQP